MIPALMSAAAVFNLRIQQHIWLKTKHKSPSDKSYNQAFEPLLCIQFGNAKSRQYISSRARMPAAPHRRSSLFHVPREPLSAFFSVGSGHIGNRCQKPWEIAHRYATNHCVLPDNNVLVLGSGSGSEILGSLAAGCNVVAFENDLYQYGLSVARVERELERHAALVQKHRADDDEEYSPQRLLMHPDAFSWAGANVGHAFADVPDEPTPTSFRSYQVKHKLVTGEEESKSSPPVFACFMCSSVWQDTTTLRRCMACQQALCFTCYGQKYATAHVCETCEENEDAARLTAIHERPLDTVYGPGAVPAIEFEEGECRDDE